MLRKGDAVLFICGNSRLYMLGRVYKVIGKFTTLVCIDGSVYTVYIKDTVELT